ncbi:hypothetical protein [Mangrovicoccus sp. HB161399]|uniref:hypothetical protein n=1 Tax=Mangrovicoccus sp. HB161399 TaxID=2720392 RepID=UPI001551AB08|nr:hypothetical protein [Mangrovicoccus sp. HB161399]
MRDLAWLALPAGLVVAASAVFAAFGQSYAQWYLASGALISLGLAAIGWAWPGWEANAGLISANPREFCGAALQVAGLPLRVMGTHLRSRNRGGPVGPLDRLLMIPWALLFAAAVLGWLMVIAPAQYFAFLVTGAPSRIALASRAEIRARFGAGRLEVEEGPAAAGSGGTGWWDASLRARPVSMALSFQTAGFGMIELISAAFQTG